MGIVLSTVEQGLIYAILALGVYITYKILDFPDLSVDSTFPLGAAVTATMITNGMHPLLTLPASMLAGALAGAVTGIIHVKCRVRDLLSGIIVMTGLYSLNLRVAQDKANLPIFGTDTLFKNGLTAALPDALSDYAPVLILLALVVLCKLCMDWFLRTRAGYLLRAVGDNPTVVTALAKDGGMVKIQGLAIANALVALSGCVMCQYQRFFEISMGTGAIVIGLASVIIGTNLFKNLSFLRATSAVVIGSILYKACVAIALSSGLLPKPQDMKFVTAVLFLLILALGEVRRKKVKAHA
ncbi:MAG TPA: ABC transporter permease [Candidatus Onthenecus intestinigallinarum]|uniref:ABC transporter permease n=1 Tax=Candidatus Onthenecus intestinigallinarum TaxID=2840875 RepID=A0A9D1CQI1_9FIRM|nr:ABC transporter permease [Candidatus Onthenecus intestinigallinarum]